MFRNFLKIAWRNLLKKKAFSFLNITGLAIGLTCFLLIGIYVFDELSYDRFHENADRIVRVNSDIKFGGTDMRLAVTSDMMGAALKKDYPQVEQFTRIYNSGGSKLVKKSDGFINEGNVAHVDSTFFQVFSFTAVDGNLHTALNEPNTVVLTASTARKYFGEGSAIGKTIETNDNTSTLYKVTAVIKDMPRNSHFNFDFLFSMENAGYEWGSYLSHNFHTYLVLKKGVGMRELESKLDEYVARYVLPQAKTVMNIGSMDDFQKAGNRLGYSLTPVTDIHLKSDRSVELSTSGNVQYVYIFSAVALFILVIACINFMNLTTARSASRAKEVGIRKVLGTEKKHLIGQFLSESTLMALLSLLLAIGLAYLFLPLFNDVSGKEMSMNTLLSPYIIPVLVILPFGVGLLAGSYPAFYLSSFQPIEVLKGKRGAGAGGGGLRSALVVFQFATSIVLIIGTIIIYRQLQYIQTKNLGFNREQVMIVNDAYALGNNLQAFRNELLKGTDVVNGTFSGYLPVSSSSRNDNSYSKEAVMDSKNGFNMQTWTVDDQYIATMGMQVVRGRSFSKEFPSDSGALVINEATAKFLGYDDPVGKKLYAISDFATGELKAYNIIGVVKNFHFESLKNDIGPLCLRLGNSTYLASFRIRSNNMQAVVNRASALWKTMAPGMPFNYRFLDDSYNEMYRGEQRIGKIALVFSVLAIFIACLGLFGLAAFVAEQRTKEIGIRKVLGASVGGIVELLSRDFIRLVLIAFLIAAPLGWWAMHRWLQDFAFRTPIAWWVFPLAAVISLLIAVLAIGFQSVKAATTNPVRNLRTE